MAKLMVKGLVPIILCVLLMLGVIDPVTWGILRVLWIIYCTVIERRFADYALRLGIKGLCFWLL